jgi:hypothetical protein
MFGEKDLKILENYLSIVKSYFDKVYEEMECMHGNK